MELTNFFDSYNNYINVIRMMIFDKVKTGNTVLDTILTTSILSLIGTLFSISNKFKFSDILIDLYEFFQRKKASKIVISGKMCTSSSNYGEFYVSSVYSTNFNALLNHIMSHINTSNSEIHEIRELYSNNNIKGAEDTHYMVSQTTDFMIDKDIYININTTDDKMEGDKSKSYIIENITLTIYSHVLSIEHLKKYLDKITHEYNAKIEKNRINKQFIYTINRSTLTLKDNEEMIDIWDENEFKSNRRFDNIFFEQKKEILNKIDFFLENKEWYDDKGLPYNLGIGLYGEPGTGKTSFIKAIANKTKRDIIIIPLKLIKNTSQLKKIFFENTYNKLNSAGSKTFDKKIIVFEDIDCIGEIVKDRAYKNDNSSTVGGKVSTQQITYDMRKFPQSNSHNNPNNNDMMCPNMILYDDPLTLDDFLNLWDGIQETSGRIIIVTSNFYNQLDPALTRPGRIDISQELKKANHEVIQEIHEHFFEKRIDVNEVRKINEYLYSPAELINIYLSCNNSEEKYVSRLQENKNVM